MGEHKDFGEKKEPVFEDYPHLMTGTNTFLAIADIIKQQLVAGVKSPLWRITDSQNSIERQPGDKPGNISSNLKSSPIQETFNELH